MNKDKNITKKIKKSQYLDILALILAIYVLIFKNAVFGIFFLALGLFHILENWNQFGLANELRNTFRKLKFLVLFLFIGWVAFQFLEGYF